MTVVPTEAEFDAAVTSGAAHIKVQHHLDLTDYAFISGRNFDSIRVRYFVANPNLLHDDLIVLLV